MSVRLKEFLYIPTASGVCDTQYTCMYRLYNENEGLSNIHDRELHTRSF